MQDERALKVLRVLLANGCSVDQEIAAEDLIDWFEEAGLEEDDCPVGLAKAALRGWVVSKTDGGLRITREGSVMAARSAH